MAMCFFSYQPKDEYLTFDALLPGKTRLAPADFDATRHNERLSTCLQPQLKDPPSVIVQVYGMVTTLSFIAGDSIDYSIESLRA